MECTELGMLVRECNADISIISYSEPEISGVMFAVLFIPSSGFVGTLGIFIYIYIVVHECI